MTDEEQRMDVIRNDAANRIKRMAESRVRQGRQFIEFNDLELQWISEDDRSDRPIALLGPQEYWAMIRSLASDLRRERQRQRSSPY